MDMFSTVFSSIGSYLILKMDHMYVSFENYSCPLIGKNSMHRSSKDHGCWIKLLLVHKLSAERFHIAKSIPIHLMLQSAVFHIAVMVKGIHMKIIHVTHLKLICTDKHCPYGMLCTGTLSTPPTMHSYMVQIKLVKCKGLNSVYIPQPTLLLVRPYKLHAHLIDLVSPPP